MPKHTPEERKKRREERDRGKPVAFVGNVPVPAREKPQLAARQEAERKGLDVGVKEEAIEAQRPEIAQQLGTAPLRQELQQQIDQPPSLQPQTIPQLLKPSEEDIKRQAEQRAFVGRLFTGKASSEEIKKEAENFAKGVCFGIILQLLLVYH